MNNTSNILIRPIAFVKNNRLKADDEPWGQTISEIILADEMPDSCLSGLADFSHVEIIFYFHLLKDSDVVFDLRYPRENKNYPLTGIFAQRGRARPNKLGATIVELLEVKKRSLVLKGLDAIHETPVIDVKPVMQEFLPRNSIKQPDWSKDLMSRYWD